MASFDQIDDINDFEKLKFRKKAEATQRNRVKMEEFAQAEVLAAQLTGSPVWDTFLSMLQSQLDDTSKELEMVKDDFVNANSLTDLELRNAREACQRLESRRLTIVQLMEIPSKLAEQGREARGLPGSDSATH